MTSLKKTLIVVAFLATGATAVSVYQARQVSSLKAKERLMEEQKTPLVEEVKELKAQTQRLSNIVASTKGPQNLPQAQYTELMQLRGKTTEARANVAEIEKLKAKLESQPPNISEAFTNAMAAGLSTAERFQKKEAQARLTRMKKMLNLSDEQETAINELQQQGIQRQTQMTMEMLSGKVSKDEMASKATEAVDQQEQIKSLLSPQQAEMLPEFEKAEERVANDNLAKMEANQLGLEFGLSDEKQQQLRLALAEASANAPAMEVPDVSQIQNGSIADSAASAVKFQAARLEQKAKVLEAFLTPEQIIQYRKDQTEQMEMMEKAMKMFLPPEANSNPK